MEIYLLDAERVCVCVCVCVCVMCDVCVCVCVMCDVCVWCVCVCDVCVCDDEANLLCLDVFFQSHVSIAFLSEVLSI